MLPMDGALPASTLWAITTFFNPVRYKQRLRNYRLFRKTLGVPLIAVELSHDGAVDAFLLWCCARGSRGDGSHVVLSR